MRLRVPENAQALKLDALDKVGPFDVEAGDEADIRHDTTSINLRAGVDDATAIRHCCEAIDAVNGSGW